MNDFADTVAGWHDFYVLAGTAAATLMGLLFVATSLKLDFLADRANAESRAGVSNSFEGFLYVLLFALIFLIPDVDPEGLGIPLFIFSVFRVISVERRAWRAYRARGLTFWNRDTIVAYQLPGIAYLLVAALTFPMMLGQTDTGAFSWFVGIILTLLSSATASAWRLLLGDDLANRLTREEWDKKEGKVDEESAAHELEADHRG